MLQRLTEDLEYHELLDRAATCENSLEQLCYVAAFTVSSYSTTVFRTSKPFNPLLGETFELDRLEENGYRSLCEQVKEPQDCSTLPVAGRGGSGGCSPTWVLVFAEIPSPSPQTAFLSFRTSALEAPVFPSCCGRATSSGNLGRD